MKSAKHRLSVRGMLLPSAIALLASCTFLAPSFNASARAALEESPKSIVDEVWQIVNQQYAGRNFNREQWQTTREDLLSRQYDTTKEAYNAIHDALNQLGDPYTRFLHPDQFEALSNQTAGELSGIGIRMAIDEETQKLTVVEPIDNSPASEAGILAGDEIVAIDGQLTILMSVEEASELIQGQSGTEVTLRLSRARQGTFDLTLTRQQIELPTVSHRLNRDSGTPIGYIKLDEFSSHAAEQMKTAIRELEAAGAQAFVLDLRGNPGGLLYSSVEIARLWLDRGEIVKTVDRKGGDRHFRANNTAITDLPLAVLVNGRSASASEILAGALKDNRRATIVGTRTYGKGTVQSVTSLSDGSGLAVTISRYYPPSGVNINKEGISPHIEAHLSRDKQQELARNPDWQGTRQDPQYIRATDVFRQMAPAPSERTVRIQLR